MDKRTLYLDKNDGYYDQRRTDLVPLVPLGARTVLEVGCANGAFGGELKRVLGARVVGVELSPEHAERARDLLDEVLIGDIEKIMPELGDCQFDLIVFNDVLEHLIDPWTVLSIAKTKLRKEGAIFAAIPNVRHWSVVVPLLFKAEWRYTDSGILDKSHLRFFTEESAARMFRQCEFSRLTIHKPLNKWSKSALLNQLTLGFFQDFLASHNVFVARA